MDFISDLLASSVAVYGTTFSINGHNIDGGSNQAEYGRVHQYLQDSELTLPAYEITFPASVLNSPYNLHLNMEIVNTITGWKLAVRNIDAPTHGNTINQVHVVAILIPRQ